MIFFLTENLLEAIFTLNICVIKAHTAKYKHINLGWTLALVPVGFLQSLLHHSGLTFYHTMMHKRSVRIDSACQVF